MWPAFPENTVAVFDLDGTITRRDTYLGILLHSLRLHPANIPRLARLAWPTLRFKLGRLDNTSLKTAYLRQLLAGLSAQALQRVARTFVDELFDSGMRVQALEAVRAHRGAGHSTVLLTASPDFYVEDIARRLDFDHCLCTRTERRPDDSLTGDLAGANCYGPEKHARLMAHLGEARGDVYLVGYGDHRTDLHLLTRLDQGFVINPGTALRQAAFRAGLDVLEWQ